MPLQRWMTEHGHPGWYSWLVVIGGALTSCLIAVTVAVVVANRSIERERAQREQARVATCAVVKRMIDVYTDPTPVTETGRNAAVAWKELGARFGC